MKDRPRIVGMAGFAFAVVLLAAWYALTRSEWAKVDQCLDAGGRWDQSTSLCEGIPK